MHYTEYSPHPLLSPYIDVYWRVRGEGNAGQAEKILPDGCVDIIYNFGDNFYTDNTVMNYGKIYLVGTMTCSKLPNMHSGIRLFGIRFKPGAFAAFFKYASLREITDRTVDFEKQLAPSRDLFAKHGINYLNRFFLDKLSTPKHALFPIIADIQRQHGNVVVEALAKKHFVTTRQLERQFNQYLGVSPKEFSSFTRFRYTYEKIRNNTRQQSLTDIALECGYHDHAHLTNEIKRFTGLPPSKL